MRLLLQVALLLVAGFQLTEGKLQALYKDPEFELVYPERIHKHRSKRDLSTKWKGDHDEFVTYRIPSNDKEIVLDLKKRKSSHGGSVKIISYDENGKHVFEDHTPEDCHYTGEIRGVKDSFAYISTCHGLTGTIDDGMNRLDILPHGNNGQHKLIQTEDILSDIHKSLKLDWYKEPKEDQMDRARIRKRRNANDNVPELRKFELINVGPQYIPHLTTNRTRYLECLMTSGSKVTAGYGNNKTLILERMLNTLGQVDVAYQAINIRFVLVALDIQTTDMFTRSSNGGTELKNYGHYIRDNLSETDDFKNIAFDHGLFFSATGWQDYVVGMAWMGGVCSSTYGYSVNAWSFNSISGSSGIIGHEVGHNLDFPHGNLAELTASAYPEVRQKYRRDGNECKCLTPRGCFMGGSKSSRPGFSDCNLKRLARKEFACINQPPVSPLLRRCGNGIKDPGEECDCGTKENCIKNNDHCCEPTSCKLKAHVQCSHYNNPGCCSETCYYRKQGTLCRYSNGNCDVEEYCTGESDICPADRLVRNGVSCGDSIQMLFGTKSRRSETVTKLSHHIEGRYFRFEPKHWLKDGWVCMRLEMYGCDVNLGSKPTPIISNSLYYHGAMCITPDIANCSNVPDGTKLKYKSMPGYDCNHPHMIYDYLVDGTLVHHCSGKKICPDSNGILQVSSKCGTEESKFNRTAHRSVKQNNKCWNAQDGWPHSNNLVKLTSSCDDTKYSRTVLNFQETDCELAQGFKSGKLPDSAFSAGSEGKGEEAYHARVNNGSKWCTPKKMMPGWLKVDLGKMQKITHIGVQSGSYWNWITGYHLYYSRDNVQWHAFKEVGAKSWKDDNSVCYKGQCVKTYDHQCRELWDSQARKASDGCWNKLNVEAKKYGTCSAIANVSCAVENVFCGQLQCTSPEDKPYYFDYGTSYAKFDVNTTTCSAAAIIKSEQVGLGMVEDGTKCGTDKYCVSQQCKTATNHGKKICKHVNGMECNKKGVCRNDGVCQCEGLFNPSTGCAQLYIPINGGFSAWSKWTTCTHGCGGGNQTRYRHCDQPVPKHGGIDCKGQRMETQKCNTDACPIGRSCKAIYMILKSNKRPLYDGIYQIKPDPTKPSFSVYCDMTADGGGWTLIVSSHMNNWTEKNVLLRNKDKPSLTHDYSILSLADSIKNNYLIKDTFFEYKLEAHTRGLWGGIWKAPNTYMINSKNRYQTDVTLIKKFSNWEYQSRGLQERLPYVYKQRLTTSDSYWGSITDNIHAVLPSYWIGGNLQMENAEHVWYWMREGDYSYPSSCLEIMYRGFNRKETYPSGYYKIEINKEIVQTYCDLDRYGGGWTLVTKVTTRKGWTKENSLIRNENDASQGDFSIFKHIDSLKHKDPAEDSFQYMIEANGNDQNGGIFSLPVDFTLLNCPPTGKRPTLLQKFGAWSDNQENWLKYPIRAASKNGVFVTASSDDSNDILGTIISSGSGKYSTSLSSPSIVKMWVREGGSRKSCNDIKIRGYHKGKLDYKDGFYMIQGFQSVYCDMETTPKEGWTLLVSSITNGWSGKQVRKRNTNRPSLFHDFSILDKADGIKAMSKNTSFKYMLDAKRRRHWGGIWTAPIEYSFTQTSSGLENVNMIRKFSEWAYESNWWSKPRKRFPYLGRPSMGKALLTTASYDSYTEWGTIIANNSDGNIPAKWIYSEMKSPGAIWYWLNENDCNADYAKVDGGFTNWSSWTKCSSFCGKGTQKRTRTCSNPIAKCGGDECPASEKTEEIKTCTGTCDTTIITTFDGSFCLEPESGECNQTDNTKIVFRSAVTHCKGKEAQFAFDRSSGKLVHKCSNKTSCFKDGSTSYNTEFVVSSTCPEPTQDKHLSRTYFDTLQFHTKCLDPSGGVAKDGIKTVLWTVCTLQDRRIIMPDIAKGVVKVSKFDFASANFDAIMKNPSYPNSPTTVGRIDNLDVTRNIGTSYALRMQAYFIAPQSGDYQFVVVSDDQSKVFLSTSDKETDKLQIIFQNEWTGYLQWTKYSFQKSNPIRLEVGKKYYIEGVLREGSGDDHLAIGVHFPDGTSAFPITNQYLGNFE